MFKLIIVFLVSIYALLTFARLHIFLVITLKLQLASLGCSCHTAPYSCVPSQRRVAVRVVEFKSRPPQGQLSTAVSPRSVSGH